MIVRKEFIKGTVASVMAGTILLSGCSGGSLSTREKGAGIGALGGAAAGGIVGAAVRHPAAGALIGGALGLGAGALIGDQLMSQDKKQNDQQLQIDRNRDELERLRRENLRLREQSGER